MAKLMRGIPSAPLVLYKRTRVRQGYAAGLVSLLLRRLKEEDVTLHQHEPTREAPLTENGLPPRKELAMCPR
jgi:hypothetical protein